MTSPPSTGDPHFADLLDDLLEQFLNGEDPDLAATAARHPNAAQRLDEAIALAGSLAGRKVSSRPALQGYEILRELGRGGMGTVYLAKQASLAREVALKVLPHSFGLSAASRQRFLEEARALAHVKHEHIVDIHRIVDDGELLAFEMEFVDGPSLHTVLETLRAHRKNTGTPATLTHVAEAIGVPAAQLGARNLTQFFVRLLQKVARALAAVHAAGFVHRDVKPANLLLRRNGEPVVVDFGLVRLRGLDATHVGSFAGTPVYSSPEQLRGDTVVGPASDVYSLAVTLYECLTLATPFAGRTTTDLLQRIEKGSFAPLRRLAPEAPRDLETIVAHAMEVDPLQRYGDAGALADDLQRLLELQPIRAKPVHPVRRVGKFLRRNQRTVFAACGGAILVAAALVPILHRVEAAGLEREAARRASREHVATARQHLISVESGSLDWRRTVWGNLSRARLVTAGERLLPLRQALAEYERALSLTPNDETADRERNVVQLAIWLQQLTVTQRVALERALAGEEFSRLTTGLGPLTEQMARALAGPETQKQPPAPEAIAGAADDDRSSLGLLAFLFGEFRLCEQAWGTLEPDVADQPLVDAGLGMLLLADGMPEAAYVRLLQAQRHFPASATLALELADTALRLGDLGLARQWLARLPDSPGVALPRQRLELDLRAACESSAGLTADYEQLASVDPHNPAVPHRLAQLAMRRGDLEEAQERLDELLTSWPESAQIRLDRARVALQRRDLAGYAQQVLAVLEQDFGRNRSRGATADLLEVLRIGGLENLYLEGIAATGKERTGRAFVGGEMPIQSFAPLPLTRDFEDLAHYVHAVRTVSASLLSGGSWLDDTSAQLFVKLPMALALLPGSTSLPARLTLAAVPSTAKFLYPLCLPTLHSAYLRLPLSDRNPVQLDWIEPAADLPAETAFANSLLTVHDLSGDGVDDVLLSCVAPDPQAAPGHLLIVDGRTTHVLATLYGNTDQHMFGYALDRAGDIDGDRCPDWIIGAPSGSSTARGRAELWSGQTQQLLARFEGDDPGFGVSVAGLGDCDGDGCPDLAVGSAPFLRNSAAQGSVRVFSGRTHEVLHTLLGDVAGVWFGACLANAGDTDGDAIPDILVGGNFGAAPGLVRLYSGRTGAILQNWSDATPTSGFGTLVRGVGDLDGDGSCDVVIAAVRRSSHDGLDQVFFYSGSTGRQLAVLSGKRPGAGFGSAVMPYGGEGGHTTLAIGSPFAGEPDTGMVEFWTVSGELISTLVGPIGCGKFGAGIALSTDDDGDGLPELFVAAPWEDGKGRAMRIRSKQWRSRAR